MVRTALVMGVVALAVAMTLIEYLVPFASPMTDVYGWLVDQLGGL